MLIEEKFDKTLTSKMRTLIEEHEEAYEIGAWESFDGQLNGSKINRYKFVWIGLAASFVMGMFLTNIYTINNDGISSSSVFANSGSYGEKLNPIEGKVPGSYIENNLALANIEDLKINFISSGKETVSAPIVTNKNNIVEIPADKGIGAYLFDNQIGNKFPAIENGGFAFSEFKKAEKRNCLFSQAKIGAQLSPLMALNSGSKLGWSTGLITEIPLVKNISLTAGFLLNRQNVAFQSNSEEGTNIRSRVKMVAMELPLNIKYNIFKKKKKEISVSAGVSSIAYLQQQFSDNSQVDNTAEMKPDSFNRVEPARFANVAASVEFPIEKNLSVLVEPFVKVPLGNTTNREIKFANAGVNVRLNYSLARLN